MIYDAHKIKKSKLANIMKKAFCIIENKILEKNSGIISKKSCCSRFLFTQKLLKFQTRLLFFFADANYPALLPDFCKQDNQNDTVLNRQCIAGRIVK